MQNKFYKRNPKDTIWWVDSVPRTVGEWRFTFDKEKIFYFYRDYPWGLTKEQKEIFDRENPFLADWGSEDRTISKKETVGE